MGGLSLLHWLMVLAWVAVFGVPVARILQRAGLSRWWTILAFVPLANLAGLWIFAYARWPAIDPGPA